MSFSVMFLDNMSCLFRSKLFDNVSFLKKYRVSIKIVRAKTCDCKMIYEKSIDYFIVRITDDELALTLKIARSLRKSGRRVEYNYKLIPVKKQMARASRVRAAKVLILGADEISAGTVVEKDLATGVEDKISIKSESICINRKFLIGQYLNTTTTANNPNLPQN